MAANAGSFSIETVAPQGLIMVIPVRECGLVCMNTYSDWRCQGCTKTFFGMSNEPERTR
eukprot:CAMPEP_0185789158 /NCGR_PEP_ID=MMETSP1174-20130828/149584_1 /TAXON_ID=35687 /ORGANISM="Dictyocha speculum, Strain CCMP1381" /LENGTH=58 /DNA_ID=CAMNT_0028483167 /DNA_START=492 /DNA_END=668 /DNA_ORIENTATION=+